MRIACCGLLALGCSLTAPACVGRIHEQTTDSSVRDVHPVDVARSDDRDEPSADGEDHGMFDVSVDEDMSAPDVTTMDVPAIDDARDDIAQPADVPVAPIDAGPSSTRHIARILGWNDAPNGFYEYLPPGYDGTAPTPLLVFWHGIGEDGNGTTELDRVLANGPPRLIRDDAWPADRPFVVLSAQHGPSGCPGATEIHDFIAWAMTHYAIDTHRVYLSGMSCGAIGSWSYINQYVDQQIAAAVLVAGDPGDPTQSWSAWGHDMCSLGSLAIWAIHGDADGTVNYGNENGTMNNLLACPSPPRKETHWNVIAGGGHDTWTQTYNLSYGFEVYDFLLRQSR